MVKTNNKIYVLIVIATVILTFGCIEDTNEAVSTEVFSDPKPIYETKTYTEQVPIYGTKTYTEQVPIYGTKVHNDPVYTTLYTIVLDDVGDGDSSIRVTNVYSWETVHTGTDFWGHKTYNVYLYSMDGSYTYYTEINTLNQVASYDSISGYDTWTEEIITRYDTNTWTEEIITRYDTNTWTEEVIIGYE